MPKLRHRDIQEVIQLFENELTMMGRVGKVEKMKLRRKINNVVHPALSSAAISPEIFVSTVEEKLSDIVRLFMDPHGFKEKLIFKVRELTEKEDEQWGSPGASEDS